jgi:hypothetical protein
MADQKLSQLNPATTPLTGAELVYLVQGGSSKGTTAAALAGALPDATPTTAGKLSAADKARLDQLAASGSPSFAGLTITGSNAVVIPHIHGDVAGTLYFHVKNVSGGPLTKGTPVSVVGAVGDTTTLEVEATNPSVVGVTQAHGLLYADLADNASGHAVLLGELQEIDTSAYAPSTVQWVGASGGRTGTRPASGAQQVATVGRQHATTGTLLVAIQGVEPTSAQIGADPAGTAASAMSAHLAAADPHAQYLTQTEGDARYPLTTDSRLSNAREWTAATITQADAEAGTSTTRTAWTAQRWRQAAAAWWLTVTSSVGRSLAAAADAAAARTAIGAGTSNLAVGSTTPADLAATAAAGTSGEAARADHAHALPPVVSNAAAGLAPAIGTPSGRYLRDDATWATVPSGGGGSPAGTATEIQYRDGTAFGAIPGSVVDNTTGAVTLARLLLTANGAASVSPLALTGTWFTGGTGTNNYPQLLISPTGATLPTFNTAGTGAIINAPNGFTGNLFWLGTNGSVRLAFDNAGSLNGTGSNYIRSFYEVATQRLEASSFIRSSNGEIYNKEVGWFNEAANVSGFRNGTNAQTFRVYNTFTSTTNFERAKVEWSNNILRIGTEKGTGGGTARDVELQTDGTTRITLKADGAIIFTGLPTTNPAVTGQLWNDGGTLKIS